MTVSIAARPQRRSILRGCLIAGLTAGLLSAVVIAAAAIVSRGHPPDFGPLVTIYDPADSSLVELGSPVDLTVTANYSAPLTRLEVYAEGTLVAAVDANQEGGETPLVLLDRWSPAAAGRYMLMARAFTAEGTFGDSPLVFVDVAEASGGTYQVNTDELPRGEDVKAVSLADVATAMSVSVDVLRGLNPDLDAIAQDAPIPPGTLLTLPWGAPGQPTSSIGRPGAAAPPATHAPTDVRAVVRGCGQVEITWTDVPDESWFEVWRASPGAASSVSVGRLTRDTTRFIDVAARDSGEYRYQVVNYFTSDPTRPARPYPSPVAVARMPPDCSPAPPLPRSLELQLLPYNMVTSQSYDGIYCYLSFNSEPNTRVPSNDFNYLPATTAGRAFNLQNRSHPYLYGGPSIHQPEDLPIRFAGECHGVRGARTTLLGRFSASHPAAQWNGQLLTATGSGGTGFTLRYCIRSVAPGRETGCLSDTSLFPVLPLINPVVFTSVSLSPPFSLMIGTDRQACAELRSDLLAMTNCLVFGQPHVSWQWRGTPPNSEATISGYQVTMTVNGNAWRRWGIYGGDMKTTLARLAGISCQAEVVFRVQAWSGNSYSAPSEPVRYTTPPCRTPDNIEIRAVTMHLGGSAGANQEVVDDGDVCILCTDRRLELATHRAGYSYGPYPYSGLISDYLYPGFNLFGACPDATQCYNPPGSYAGLPVGVLGASFPPPGPGHDLVIVIEVYDADTNNSPDRVCWGTVRLRARSYEDWMRVNEDWRIESDYGEASCTIDGTVRRGS